MATPSRKEVQEKIEALKELYPNDSKAQTKDRIGTWLDSKELDNLAFTQEEMKQRILADLNSYIGLREED